jgi:L-2,4-diaminobutyrate decarboxylase
MTFLSDAQVVLQALDRFYKDSLSAAVPVIQQPPMRSLVEDLQLHHHLKEGGLTGQNLSQFVDTYLGSITRVYHPANIAHQQAVPHPSAALAGLIDHFVSSDGSIYELGPASVSIEYFLINWLLQKIGWEPAPLEQTGVEERLYGGGILTHGGSLANLTALITARSKLAPMAWQDGNPEDLVILAPAETHYSIARAAGILGLGHRSLVSLEVDHRAVILPDRLPEVYDRLVADGKRPLALVANAGTTAVGLYDPIQEIGIFCREQGIWFHVDGAHGGPAILSDKYRKLLRGIELADSFTINMHKLMRVTAFCTALLVRDAQTLDQAFAQDASYLFHEKKQPGFDFLHRTIECTKPVLGLKFFMVLAAMGERGMAEYIERLFELTSQVYRFFQSLEDIDCPVEPQSNILCFSILGLDDQGHLAVRDALLSRGNYYISTASLNHKRYLRLTLTNPATSMQDIQGLIDEIRQILQEG